MGKLLLEIDAAVDFFIFEKKKKNSIHLHCIGTEPGCHVGELTLRKDGCKCA